jgi:hypothetical protein
VLAKLAPVTPKFGVLDPKENLGSTFKEPGKE